MAKMCVIWSSTIQDKNVVPNNIPPTCQKPERLQSKSWSTLSLDDFACPPTVIKTVQIMEQKADN